MEDDVLGYLDFIDAYNKQDFDRAGDLAYGAAALALHDEMRLSPRFKMFLAGFLQQYHSQGGQFPDETSYGKFLASLLKLPDLKERFDLRRSKN